MTAYTLRSAIHEAKHRERTNHKPHYIVRCVVNTKPHIAIYNVTSRMPLLGEWYTSDGIQHGE